MYTRRITSEETDKMKEVKRITNAEKEEKTENLKYYIKQKLIALLGIATSIIAPLVCDGDATISLIMLPLGIYVLFTKEKVVM